MITFNEKTQAEITKLIEIGKKYTEGSISESLLLDVMQSLKNDPSKISAAKAFIAKQGVEVVSYSHTVEDTDENYDTDSGVNIKPYDPSQIDISPKNQSLDILLGRIENDEIDLMPDFQRKAGLWSATQKSQLIESLILRIPLPAFYFDGTDNDKWVVIDGLQRLTALKEFFVEKTLRLSGLEFLKDLNGVNYKEMPQVYLRRMKETQIVCYIINPGAPVNLKYNIFKRINTGGLHLEPQEIRHALFQGYATKYLKQLANCEMFKLATGYSVPTDRMLDREFVLRFIAFYEFGVEKYDGSIDEFLNNAMELINQKYCKNPSHADLIENKFYVVLDVCEKIFGRFAFRRMPDKSKRRTISKALFETWMSILAKYDDNMLHQLVARKEILIEKYMPMFSQDEDFYNSIGSGKVSAVRKRFEKIQKLVSEVLDYVG